MAGWSQSHFLQSLGWATLNSFWQMALLWCLFLAASRIFHLSSQKKYQLSVISITTGFFWFISTFLIFFQSSSISTIAIFNQSINENNNFLQIFLIAASVTYLVLLVFPAYRLFQNWKFVQKIKKEGLKKADLTYRLFVQKIAAQLGLKKKVQLYLSEFVHSPLTVGYLKPIILLPVSALNHLSTQQAEAILLHELSHIRRYDYLINFVISIFYTLLYFNPFVKQFMKHIESERESCCDQMVLQFGYDSVGYASALLTLEKVAATKHELVMGAAGKKYLLNRIEKIVGMEKKPKFKLNDFAGILAALFCIVVFNSVLIIKEEKKYDYTIAYNELINPLHLIGNGESEPMHSISPTPLKSSTFMVASASKTNLNTTSSCPLQKEVKVSPKVDEQPLIAELPNNQEFKFLNVGFDEIDGALSNEQKEKVAATVDATKKVYKDLQWAEAAKNIADAMNEQEKEKAKQVYMKQLEQSKMWKTIEDNMKAKYEELDWTKINSNLITAQTAIKLDSMQKVYNQMVIQLDKACEAASQAAASSSANANAISNQSVLEITKAKESIIKRVEVIKAIRENKKVVHL